MERALPPVVVVVVDHLSAVARVDVTASVSLAHHPGVSCRHAGTQQKKAKRWNGTGAECRVLSGSNIPLPQIKTVPFDPVSMTFSDNGSCSCKQANVLTEEHMTLHDHCH